MQIKRYEVESLQEALLKIKKDMGEDSVVLSSKKIKGEKGTMLEVIAARDDKRIEYVAGERIDSRSVENVSYLLKGELCFLKDEISYLKSMLEDMRRGDSLHKELKVLRENLNSCLDLLCLWNKEMLKGVPLKIYRSLVANGISPERAFKLTTYVENVEDYAKAVGILNESIARQIPVTEEKWSKRIKAFIGPTGVGKTTTIAKLAAHYAIGEKKRIGLITTDTYRIAAVDQLKTYAKIIGIPVEVVNEEKAFHQAVRAFADKDYILIDTPGKSRYDEKHMEKLRYIKNIETPVETNLLLSLTSSRDNMLDESLKYAPIKYDSIIFTKIDEGSCFGAIYDVIEQIGKPISYLTNGQNVPKDLIHAKADMIAAMIMGNKIN